MKKIFLSIFTMLIITMSSYSQQFCLNHDWANQVSGEVYYYDNNIVLDDSGNTYLTGNFYGNALFGSINLTGANGSGDIFFVKIAPNGNFVWAESSSGTNSDGMYVTKSAVNSKGELIVTGYFMGEIVFGNDTLVSEGEIDAFIVKLDRDGNFIWVENLSSNGGIIAGFDIKTDVDDNIYILGALLEEDINPSYFIVKISPNGDLMWADVVENGFNGEAEMRLAVDKDKNAYVYAHFYEGFEIGQFKLVQEGGAEIYVVKYNEKGQVEWVAQSKGQSGEMYCSEISIDQKGDIYLAGNFYGTKELGKLKIQALSGSSDIFLIKVNPKGEFVMAKTLNNNGYHNIIGLGIDNQNNCYLSGTFEGKVSFDKVSLTSSSGTSDGFLTKLDEKWNCIWATKIGGSDYDVASLLRVDRNNDIILIGSFSGTVDFGDITLKIKNQYEDVFITKISESQMTLQSLSDTAINCGETIKLNPIAKEFENVQWQPNLDISDNFALNPEFKLKNTRSYTLTLIDKCKNTIVDSVTISVLKDTSYQDLTICEGDTVWIGRNIFRFKAGTYVDAISSSKGCDSTVITKISINPSYKNVQDVTICEGDQVIFNNKAYTKAGTYIDSFKTALNCDSLFILNLTVNPNFNIRQSLTICEGESVFVGNSIYSTSGIYYDTLQTVSKCDSIVETTLTVNPLLKAEENYEICEGDIIMVRNKLYDKAGIFQTILKGNQSCDTVLTVSIKVNSAYEINQKETICKGDTVFVGNNFYTAEGSFKDILKSQSGCDSIVLTEIEYNDITLDNTVELEGNTLIAKEEGDVYYQWLDCDDDGSPIAGATEKEFTPTVNGNYSVSITSKECSSVSVESECSYIELLGVKNHNLSNVKVYPNPASKVVIIESKTLISELILKDLNGKEISRKLISDTYAELDIKELSAGMYLIEIIDVNGSKLIQKINKE